jgi:hypothetical protein
MPAARRLWRAVQRPGPEGVVRHTRALIVVLCLVWGVPALAESGAPSPPAAPTNDDCLACHGDPSAARADGRSVAVSAPEFGGSIHGQAGIACVDCHADLPAGTEFPHPERLAPVACGTCHDEAATKYTVSVHAEARRASPDSVAATCKDCHGTHDVRTSQDPASRTYHLNLPQTCGTCHGSAEVIKRGKIAAGNVYAMFQDSIHGHALTRSGLMVAPNCIDCHGFHDIRRRNQPESGVNRLNVPATCARCHQGVGTLYANGIHGISLKKGNPLAPVCSDCHTAHEIQQADVESWRLQVIRECGTCHAESIRTYRDTFHGQVTGLGFVRVAACSDCHGAHEILPKADARSTVSSTRVVETCRKCHPAASASFARYDPHADRQNRTRNPALYYASRFMSLLLLVVFSFFGIHTTLWFSRTLRKERPGSHDKAEVARPRAETSDDDRAGEQ